MPDHRPVPQAMFLFHHSPHDPRGLLVSVMFYGLVVFLLLFACGHAPMVGPPPPPPHPFISLTLSLPAPIPPVRRSASVSPALPAPIVDPPPILPSLAPRLARPAPEPRPGAPLVMDVTVSLPEVKSPLPRVVEGPQAKPVLGSRLVAAGAAMGRPSAVSLFGAGNASQTRGNGGAVGVRAVLGPPDGSGPRNGWGSSGQGPCGSALCSPRAGVLPHQASLLPSVRVATPADSIGLSVVSQPQVVYPDDAQRLGVQGDVVLRVTFAADGRVVVLGVIRGLGHGLDEEARRVVEGIRFKPATSGGTAIDVTTTVTISFQLA